MKNAYHFLPALAALLAAAPAARAQQAWQPFRPNVVYQYTESTTPGDTTHTLQVGAGAAVAGTADTLYRFNRRAPKADVRRFQGGSGANYQLVADNLFGATLRAQPGAVFVLAAANGRTLTLRPRAPLGRSWAAGPAGLTAHVMSRVVAPVPGGAPDSVALLMLSDGQVVQLSKRHGLLAGPSLDSYLNGRNRRRSLRLTALTGTAAPQQVGALAAFDFRPGTVLQRHATSDYGTGQLCSESWIQDSVLTRVLSRTGDSVIYTVRTRRLDRGYGQAGAPGGFCSTTGSNYTATTGTLIVERSSGMSGGRPVATLTNTFGAMSTGFNGTNGYVSGPAVRSPRYYRRPEWEQQTCILPTGLTADSARLQPRVDYGTLTRYAQGLGLTRLTQFSFSEVYDEQLVAYHKETEVWGNPFNFPQLLAARTVLPAATTAAFPQPFGASLTVKFDLARPQPVRLALHDALGRTVLAQPAAPLAAGPQQLVLATSHLPAGLYTLHIELLGEGRSEVLKVVRAE